MKLNSGLQALGALLLATGFARAEYAVLNSKSSLCPEPCGSKGPGSWDVYSSVDSLSQCEEPMLFDFSVFNPLDNPETTVKIRACAAGKTTKSTSNHAREAPAAEGKSLPSAQSAWWSPTIKGQNTVVAIEMIEDQVAQDDKSETGDMFFSYFNKTVVGLYMGSRIDRSSGLSTLIDAVNKRDQLTESSRSILQTCGGNLTAAYTVGLVTSGDSNLLFVQDSVKAWAEAKCVSTGDASGKETVADLKIKTTPSEHSDKISRRHAHPHSHHHSHHHSNLHQLFARASCTTTKVNSGDSCASLASECGVTRANFIKYNSYDSKLCSTLVEGQVVCCSAGSLPDLKPKPEANGECASYTTEKKDTCSAIAAANGLKVEDLDKFNKETWGWNGCKNLLVGQTICLSSGDPVLPASVSNAQCGPTKPGTKAPKSGTKLADVNPCPLKACCNIWGQCGTTKDYCTISKSSTGNPGTSKPGENGCISNCGMEIVNNDTPPDSFKKIAYFESWNQDRPCMHMDVRTITSSWTSGWTHVHFAFANITSDYKVSVKDTYGQFKNFKGLKGIKRIVAFGGWSFSVGTDTYLILREAVKPANREAFATEVVKFVNDNDLDGVDFDWEYPGAPDLPDIPAGSKDEPANYLKFLQLVKSKLPKDKSLSIAAPASYWYLKQFPIAAISKTVDYIVYMTYDLHGQWDYESPWAADGCPKGSCLRSHVNLTETESSLAMVTKAGVEARKLVVGVSSYGRSFKMSSAKCKGPMCTFVGPESAAAKGECTDTAGYISNAEIETLIHTNMDKEKWYDRVTDTDYLIYDDTEWVAYMSEDTKKNRMSKYKGLNFGGTSDWAIDLQEEWADEFDIDGNAEDEFDDELEYDWEECDKEYDSVEDIPESVTGRCGPVYVLGALSKELAVAIKDYKEVSEGYDDKFKWYVDWVKDGINPALDSFMQLISGEGNKYMDCEWESIKSKGSGPCTKLDLKVSAGIGAGGRVVKYKMRDEEGFYKALLEKTGIEKDWIDWREKFSVNDPCFCAPSVSVASTAKNVDKLDQSMNLAAIDPPCPCAGGHDNTMYMNYPRRTKSTGDINVPNPKELIDEAIPKTDELAELLDQAYNDAWYDTLDASGADAATAFSMPVFMLEDAIESIKKVKEIGEKQKKTKTRELVMNILSIVFMVIPFVGSAATAMGGAALIARAALIIGEAGNAALSIVDIVDDPASAPFAILGMLIGATGVRVKGPRQAYKDAAEARRALDSGKLKAFSPEFRYKDGIVQSRVKGETCSIK